MAQKHTISLLVENHFGVLARVAGLISARGFNIDSLTVGTTEDPTVSRMTIVVDADARQLEQVKKQLNRLIDIIKVQELKEGEYVDRELLLVKLEAAHRAEILQVAQTFHARVADLTPDVVMLECLGEHVQINALLTVMKPFGILEVVRTGRVALARGGVPRMTKEPKPTAAKPATRHT